MGSNENRFPLKLPKQAIISDNFLEEHTRQANKNSKLKIAFAKLGKSVRFVAGVLFTFILSKARENCIIFMLLYLVSQIQTEKSN